MHDNRINAAAPAYIALTMCEGAALMFMFTVTKPGLRQAGALALCAVCLCGTVAAAKEKGLLRSEGKDYVVKDGDMIYFRFNV